MVEGPALADFGQALAAGNGLDALLIALHLAERGLLDGLHRVGLVGAVHGQAAWPWAVRIASDNLVIDRGHARGVAWSLAAVCALGGLLLVLLGSLIAPFRRVRPRASSSGSGSRSDGGSDLGFGVIRLPLLAALAIGILLATPWPDSRVLWAAAHPTSFHRSPTGYSAASVVAGEAVHAAHCARCHGGDSAGEGPDARSLSRWPPSLIGPLLWRRTDGELFWRVREGLADRHGRSTMPGFGDVLSDAEVWAVLDYLKANAAGQSLRRSGEWPMPVAVPDAEVRCVDGRRRSLRPGPGERLRIVADAGRLVISDPRFTTVLLLRPEPDVRSGEDPLPDVDGDRDARAECRTADAAAWHAFSTLAGLPDDALAGTRFLTDRRGWLRVRAPAGQDDWSESDLLCRSGDAVAAASVAAASVAAGVATADPLDTLLRRMDAEPVRLVRGSVPH